MSAESAAILVLSVGIVGLSGAGIGLGVHVGALRARISKLTTEIAASEKEHAETRTEFEAHQRRTAAQINKLQDDLTDYEDLLASCSDPAVARDRFDQLLQKAAGRDGDPSSD